MNLASLLRYMQLYTHLAHNLLGGETFHEDHAFFADLYAGYEADYDSVIERMIGLGEQLDLVKIQKDAASDLKTPKSFDEAYKEILYCEEELISACEKLAKSASLGTENMLAGIADKSEARQYRLKQRLK